MSRVRTIFRNMSWMVVSQIISSVCGFIWTILVARYLGVSDYGILGFAISLTGILGFTMDWGISNHIVRHVANDYDSAPKYLGNAIPLKTLFSIGTITITIIILILMNSSKVAVIVTLLFSVELIINSFRGLLNGTFQAFEEGKYQGIENTIANILLLIFILISIYADLGIYSIAVSYITSRAFALIYDYYILRKNITEPIFELDKEFCKKIIYLSLPFAINGILYTIYYSIDVVMLTNLVGSYATGIYNASYKLISVLNVFYSVYVAVIFPVMSKFYKNDKKLLIVTFEKSVKYLLMVIIPIAFATMLYSVDIIHLIYGHEYDAASSVLSILIWTVCFLFLSGATNNLLIASHKEVTVTKFYVIAAIFNISFNFIMIPHFSYNGAAITTVLSDILIVVLQIFVIYKLEIRPNRKLYYDLGKIITGSIVLGISLYFLNLNMWVALPVGIMIYFATVYLLRLFDDDDKYVMKEILGKN